MGADKGSLPFGTSTMLRHIVETLLQVVSPVCVIASKNQKLPDLPDCVIIGTDEEPDRGPIAGLLAGMNLLRGKTDKAFCSSCDAPLLLPDVVRLLVSRLEAGEIAAPFDGEHWSPLSAVYRIDLAERIERDRETVNSPNRLIRISKSIPVPLEEIRKIDPGLRSLWNLNTPEEYRQALRLMTDPKASLSDDQASGHGFM